MLSIRNLSFRYKTEIFSHLNLTVPRGDFLYLTGPNGAGKTSLLRIIAGLIPSVYPGEVGGSVQFEGEPIDGGGRNICLTGPWAASRLFCRTVWEEISFSPSASEELAESLLRYFGIEELREKHPQRLSGGEQQLVLLCAYLSSDPDLILLDESFAPLSQEKSDLLAQLLIKKHKSGKTIILVEHSLPAALAEHVRIFELTPPGDLNQRTPKTIIFDEKSNVFPDFPLLLVKNLVVDIPQGPSFTYQDFSLPRAGLLHLEGPVGSGKSTLIRALSGLLTSRGDIRLGDRDLRSLNRRAFCRRISVVLQSPDSQFFCNTVEEEICYAASLCKMKDEDYLQSLYDIFEIGHSLKQSPFSLSHGEKKKCQLASALALKPEILILDEPDAHLDGESMGILIQIFSDFLNSGKGIIFTSHNEGFIKRLKRTSFSVISCRLEGNQCEI